MRIGAHMSVSGGVSKAVERAVLHGCEALQIFAKNASQWRGRPLDPAEAARFRTSVAAAGLHPVVSHASYLINMATTVPALREQSIDALVDEIARAETLGLLGVVIHPGTCTSGTETDAFALVADTIRRAFAVAPASPVMLLLENTAGQGRTIGYRFEHLAAIIERLDGATRVGVCLDTCHLTASGYDIVSDEGYARTFEEFGKVVGFDRLRVIHGNDSKKPCGSRVDRHEHIGDGCLGLVPFRRLLADARMTDLPLLIETEKRQGSERPNAVVLDEYDVKNLGRLRGLREEHRRALTVNSFDLDVDAP